ncbi:MAG: hypothetical protein JW893_01090 [Candidatus Omnitrophica bacterium]|nr:hypothetical protein [Candidatus Omnitrophota bacterium]
MKGLDLTRVYVDAYEQTPAQDKQKIYRLYLFLYLLGLPLLIAVGIFLVILAIIIYWTISIPKWLLVFIAGFNLAIVTGAVLFEICLANVINRIKQYRKI